MKSNLESVREMAKIAIIDSRLAKQLQNFFLQRSSHQDHRDIDAWMHMNGTHMDLFELLSESRANGDFEPCMKLVLRIAREKTNPWYQYRPIILRGFLIGAAANLFFYIVYLCIR